MSKRIYQQKEKVVYSCTYYVVFCPKYRRKVLINGVDVRLKELIKKVAADHHFDVGEAEIESNRVTLCLEVSPQFGIHRAVKAIKSYSAHVLTKEFPWLKKKIPSLWTNAYFVSTVGSVSEEAVEAFISNQRTSQTQQRKDG